MCYYCAMKCTYCNDPADTLDHVVPHSFARANAKLARRYNRKLCVPACRECNQILGNKKIHTVWDRAGYLAGKYTKRYKKALSMPDWSPQELKEMGKNMRHVVETGLQGKKEINERIKFAEYRASLYQDISEIWEEMEERGEV